jgi:hypothetical protein
MYELHRFGRLQAGTSDPAKLAEALALGAKLIGEKLGG